jgi:hypothetical protein
MDSVFPHLTADDITCDQAEFATSKLDIFEPATGSNQSSEDQPAQRSTIELPPPNRFRRQSGKKGFVIDLKVRSQTQNYLAAYREATGRLLTEACSTARPLNKDEVHEIARQIYLHP